MTTKVDNALAAHTATCERIHTAEAEAARIGDALAKLRRQLEDQQQAVDAAAEVTAGAMVDALLTDAKPAVRPDAPGIAAMMEVKRLTAAVAEAERRHAAAIAEAEAAREAVKVAADAVTAAEFDATKPALLAAWRAYRDSWHRYRAAADASGAYVTIRDVETVELGGERIDVQAVCDLLTDDAEILRLLGELVGPKLRAELHRQTAQINAGDAQRASVYADGAEEQCVAPAPA